MPMGWLAQFGTPMNVELKPHETDAPPGGPGVTTEHNKDAGDSLLQGVSAVTLATHDMARAVAFYQALGFVLCYGGADADFTSLCAGQSYLNLIAQPAGRSWSWWGRIVFRVWDVDALYQQALAAGLRPDSVPRDAPWGERFFHLTDLDGHELSFATPLAGARTDAVGDTS
jgi:catechol 2,3-dioxygenase-like lactoylglutathione lyase family enzyme